MKIVVKRFQVVDLFNAIKALDGRDEVVQDENKKVIGVVKKPYVFEDAKAIYAMAKTREKIRSEVLAFEEAQQKTVANKENPDNGVALRELAIADVEIEVHQLPIASLRVKQNGIPPSILCDLLPMLEGEIT